MSENNENSSEIVEKVSENLFNFSIDQNDLKSIIKSVKDDSIDMVNLEYEIQILKIVLTGWSISYFMEGKAEKKQLSESFWIKIHEFSKNLSSISTGATGKKIEYFIILNERLEVYVKAITELGSVNNPVDIVGHVFAEVCGDKINTNMIDTGKNLFSATILAVRTYLESVDFKNS